ncbi:MAG: cytochrome B subunit [Bdellovibrio sp. CG10_big_fil_rev_8_21_14_0_10_47_8]|nr:MAG: cytochrome B subunit [Bdellovibrio sp. CG10_big_fil_rev_8_21_14_0_10_47_8]
MSVAAVRPFFRTTIGKKYLMGFTGLVWAGFVLSHMAGNLLILVGADAYNKYGHAIVTSGILIPAEIVLVLSFMTHVTLAILLTLENRKARGSRYAVSARGEKAASLASRTMAVQGSLILVFVILHISTFKYGTYYEVVVDGVRMRDLHRLVLEVFQQPGYVAWYAVCLILLGFHLSHGVGSVLQSFGWKNDHYAPWIRRISLVYGLVVAAGFLSQPLYAFFMAG